MTETPADLRIAESGGESGRFRAVFDAIDESICIIERLPCEPGALRDYRFLAINPAMMAMFELPGGTGRTLRQNFPEASEQWFDDFDRTLATGMPARFQREMEPLGIVLESAVAPLAGAPSEALVVVTRDVTERVRAQRQADAAKEHQELLAQELSHRLKNLLALVQSIAAETLRNAGSLKDASAKLSARIHALSHAADGLADAHSWREGSLHDVVRAGLASAGSFGHRIVVEGPTVTVGSRAALSLTLAVHELATNAIKYGALSNQEGKVSLIWRVSGQPEEHGGERFALEWRERGGPEVSQPDRRGFGTRMIYRALRALFTGDVCLSFSPEGVVFSIDTPLADLGATPSAE
jgi:two-component sensor histidine kinase